MKVVLVYPGITGLGFGSFGIGAEGSWINHGLCSISACLKQAGHTVELVDLRRLRGWQEFRDEIARRSPALVGVTMMSVDFEPAIECVRQVKAVRPSARTVVGGAHPTIMPEELVPIAEIDYIFRGEGEISFPRLAAAVAQGAAPGERIITGEPPDLDRLPFADRDLFGAQEQPWWLMDQMPFVTIIAGRGCKYNCSYCQPAERIIFGKHVRRRSVANVLAELKMLSEKYAFKSFMFHDDCLLEDPAWVEEFLRQYQAAGFTQQFICQGRADLIARHPELIRAMKAAGLVGLIIGFESGSQRVLNFIRKGCTVEQNYAAAAWCKSLGIRIQANYMFGLPTETPDEMRATAAMIRHMRPEFHGRSVYTPAPGSDLFSYCRDQGLITFTSHEEYRRNAVNAGKIKGVDYAFIAHLQSEIERERLPLAKRIINRLIARAVRPGSWTVTVLKRVLRMPLLNRAAHILARRVNG